MKLLLSVAMLFAVIFPTRAETVTFESEETSAALIELFSSEGCSSCPPADAWMSGLKGAPGLWKQFVPVVFHVDYWNNLGWGDRFSSAANTARQRAYAAAWRNNSIYTPGFVLSGREWRDWSPRAAAPRPSSTKVGKLSVTTDATTAQVTFIPAEAGAAGTLQVEIALLGGNLESDVKRGENRGRQLRHDFVVLSHFTAPLRSGLGHLTAGVVFGTRTKDRPVALAAWITPGDAQPPIQATGGWLAKRDSETP